MLADAGATLGGPADVHGGIGVDAWTRWDGYVCAQADRHIFARCVGIGHKYILLVGTANEKGLTSARKIHVVPRAFPSLIHHTLVPEDGKTEGLVIEEFIGDAGHSWLVHQQDRPAPGIELPSALEDDALSRGDLSACPPV